MKKKGGTSGVGYGSGTRKRRGGGADTRLGTRTKGNVLKLIKPNKKNLNTVLMFLTRQWPRKQEKKPKRRT